MQFIFLFGNFVVRFDEITSELNRNMQRLLAPISVGYRQMPLIETRWKSKCVRAKRSWCEWVQFHAKSSSNVECVCTQLWFTSRNELVNYLNLQQNEYFRCFSLFDRTAKKLRWKKKFDERWTQKRNRKHFYFI